MNRAEELLADAGTFDVPHGGMTHSIVEFGTGTKCVILLHELSGLVESTLELGAKLRDAGFRVYMPILFGSAGKGSGAMGLLRAGICLRRELVIFRAGKTSPLVDWLRSAIKVVGARAGCERVGVIGMCLTGGVVLGTLAEAKTGAVVSSQPAVPRGVLWTGGRKAAELGLAEDFLSELRHDSTQKVLALRYKGDKQCRAARFRTLRDKLGSGDEVATRGPNYDEIHKGTGDDFRAGRCVPLGAHRLEEERRNDPKGRRILVDRAFTIT